MRFHDYHLSKYEVSDFGETVTFHLVFDYPGRAKEESVIRFCGVALYHFIHASPTIILDIEEVPLGNILKEWGSQISEWNRLHGVLKWPGSLQSYQECLQTEGFRAWRIESSIGFYGFVMAQSVASLE